jgi:hypothetical protein
MDGASSGRRPRAPRWGQAGKPVANSAATRALLNGCLAGSGNKRPDLPDRQAGIQLERMQTGAWMRPYPVA